MTEQHKRSALIRYLCIFFAGAILLVALSLAVRTTQTVAAESAGNPGAYSASSQE